MPLCDLAAWETMFTVNSGLKREKQKDFSQKLHIVARKYTNKIIETESELLLEFAVLLNS